MARLIYGMIQSLDGYTEDIHGRFGRAIERDLQVFQLPAHAQRLEQLGDVLQRLGQGDVDLRIGQEAVLPPEQIASLLQISPRTVERHRENILAKLGMRDRVELTRWAIRHGLIEP